MVPGAPPRRASSGSRPPAVPAPSATPPSPRRGSPIWVSVAILAVSAIAAGAYYFWPRGPKLTSQDSIVLADFTNTTGDPVFDGTLRQGLAVQLAQSPYLNIVSDEHVAGTLRLMDQPAGARLTHDLASQVCQRNGSAAVLDGSISNLGNQYVIGLNAVNCESGDTLAREQVTANGKEQVLAAFGSVAADLRRKLGESLASIQKFNTPLEDVTTPSLDALKAYSVGYTELVVKEDRHAAVASLQRAISLDPNFAMAYSTLGITYADLGEGSLAAEYITKAYALRDRVSEPERLYSTSHYEWEVTGDLESALRTYRLWEQAYPRDVRPIINLGSIDAQLGQLSGLLAAARAAFQLAPNYAMNVIGLADAYIELGRLDEAQAVLDQARPHYGDRPWIHGLSYQIAFLRGDGAKMGRELALSGASCGDSDAAAYAGRLKQANKLTACAVASAQRAGQKEAAAGDAAEAALRLAIFGESTQARARAATSRFSSGRDVQAVTALTLALAADPAGAAKLASDLNRRYPQDTIVQFNYLPEIRATIALGRRSPAQAIAALEPAAPYELGTRIALPLGPVYVRGLAYLAAGQGPQAASEFQKILDHPGLVLMEPIGALAHLGLARARALSGDKAGARAAYQDFLKLWQHADPDIPILRQAKAEYAKLSR